MFSADVVTQTTDALDGPDWLRQQRADAANRMAGLELPSFELEEWRYSPIDELNPSRFAPAATAPSATDAVGFAVENAAASPQTGAIPTD